MNKIIKTFKFGLRQFVEHPQLWLTVLVTVSIFFSYLYIANRFITIAKNAQEELVNVRVGALQDAFAPLASILFNKKEVLREHIHEIANLNPTIQNFFIVKKDASSNRWKIITALDKKKEGTDLLEYNLILDLASAKPGNSFTRELQIGDDRFFETARAIVNNNGELLGVAVTRQSMSEADKKISQDIQKSILVLLIILLFLLLLFFRHARIIDYTVLYKKLKEIDKMKDDFVSMASHELRTPLTAIRGYVDILKGQNEVTSEIGSKALGRIDISAQELDQLIADILDVSRIEQGRLSYKMEKINPKDVLQRVIDSLTRPAEEKGLKLNLKIEDGLFVFVDPGRLRQVLVNIVGNAVKYTPKGKIDVSMKRVGNEVVFKVSDTGLGMSAEDLSHLFEKFWRSGDSAVRKQKGTGLGMWITKQIVEEMGGVIDVQSIKNVGTHFTVKFPIAKSKETKKLETDDEL